jgi:hypothetical protein
MTDINFSRGPADPDSQGAAGTSPAPRAGELRWDIIELLFFAYRDFVGDADHELEAFGFGRAHHRVMHFVYRYPGLKVADLWTCCDHQAIARPGAQAVARRGLHHPEDRQ